MVLYHSNVKGHNDLNLVNPKAITLIFLRTEWEHFLKSTYTNKLYYKVAMSELKEAHVGMRKWALM